jgi:hypothetical protein
MSPCVALLRRTREKMRAARGKVQHFLPLGTELIYPVIREGHRHTERRREGKEILAETWTPARF